MIEERVIIENAELFSEAIDHYRLLGEELVTKLAKKLNYPIEEISEFWRRELDRTLRRGMLDESWNYWFHGTQCQFRNTATGQIVDVNLKDYQIDDPLPDPYFLAQYVHTTEQYMELAYLLVDKFQDTKKMLEILVENGYWGESLSSTT